MFYIYILFSKTANKHYVGHSENPAEKLLQHNSNTTDKYTGKWNDWVMLAIFSVGETIQAAKEVEDFIKRQKSKKLLLKLIDNEFVPKDKLAHLLRIKQE